MDSMWTLPVVRVRVKESLFCFTARMSAKELDPLSAQEGGVLEGVRGENHDGLVPPAQNGGDAQGDETNTQHQPHQGIPEHRQHPQKRRRR